MKDQRDLKDLTIHDVHPTATNKLQDGRRFDEGMSRPLDAPLTSVLSRISQCSLQSTIHNVVSNVSNGQDECFDFVSISFRLRFRFRFDFVSTSISISV